MAQILVAPSASVDIFGILTDLASKAGLRTAAKYDGMFQSLYLRLTGHPASGAPRPALGQNIRIGIVSPYIVIYRHTADTGTVTILRIVHGRRRIPGRLLSEYP